MIAPKAGSMPNVLLSTDRAVYCLRMLEMWYMGSVRLSEEDYVKYLRPSAPFFNGLMMELESFWGTDYEGRYESRKHFCLCGFRMEFPCTRTLTLNTCTSCTNSISVNEDLTTIMSWLGGISDETCLDLS